MRRLLNKRACRKFSDPGLHFPKGCGILHCEQIQYVIRSAVKNIDGQRTLVLYLYATQKTDGNINIPTFAVFQTKEDFITLEHMKDGTVRWRESALDYLRRDYHFCSKCAFYRANDEERVKKYCHGGEKNGFNALLTMQYKIQAARWEQRRIKKEQKVLQRMKCIPALPGDLKEFVLGSVLPQYIFYSYKRTKKAIEGYCTACRHTVMITGQKHGKDGFCPRCGQKVKYKSRGRRSRIFDRDTVQLVQRTGDRELVIRVLKVYNDYIYSDIPSYSYFESARIFITWPKANHASEDWYYNNYQGKITPWVKGVRPHLYPYQYHFIADCCGYLYEKNLDKELLGTPWQYSQLRQFNAGITGPMELTPYFQAYFQYPVLEYLVKLRLYKLASSMVYRNGWNYSNPPIDIQGKNLTQVLGIEKEHLPIFQAVDPWGKQFTMMKDMIAAGRLPDVDFMKWCVEHDIKDSSLVNAILRHITMHKLLRYAKEQFIKYRRISWSEKGKHYSNMNDLLIAYRDYLVMAEELEFDLANDFVLFPNSLPDAHDKANDLRKKKEQAVYDTAISSAFEELTNRYGYEKADLMIVPPKCAKEIVDEGHALHHCVGSYIKRVSNGETIILFVRRKEEPDKPLCTVELKDNAISQARIQNNQDPPPKVKKFLSEWKEKKLVAPVLAAAA